MVTASDIAFQQTLSRYGKRLIIPGSVMYAMYSMRPREGHFLRYLDERRRYEGDIAARLNHPSASVSFQEHWFWGIGVAKLPTIQSLVNGGSPLAPPPPLSKSSTRTTALPPGGVADIRMGWLNPSTTADADEFDRDRTVVMEECRFIGVFGVLWYQYR